MATVEQRLPASSWDRRLAVPAALLLVGLTAGLYQPTALTLVERWNAEPRYLFGYLIPGLCLLTAWATWRRSGGPLRFDVAPSDVRRGAILFGCGTLAHFAALFVNSLPLDVFGLVLILRGAMQVWSGDVVRRFNLSFFLLLFLLPVALDVGPSATSILRRAAAASSAAMLNAVGVPTYCEGTVVQLSDFALMATTAASGLREFQGTLALCLAAGAVSGRGRLFRTILVLLSAPIAWGVNVLRIVAAGVAYSEQGRPAAERLLETFDGWASVGVACGLVVAVALALHGLATFFERKSREDA